MKVLTLLMVLFGAIGTANAVAGESASVLAPPAKTRKFHWLKMNIIKKIRIISKNNAKKMKNEGKLEQKINKKFEQNLEKIK